MKVEQLVVWSKWALALVVALWQGIPELTQLLLALMAIDLVLGIAVAFKDKAFRPSVAWSGVTRKLGSLLIVGVMALLNPYVSRIMEVNLVQAASAFYLVPELGSIIRNAATLDVPVPEQLQFIMDYFRSMSNQKEG